MDERASVMEDNGNIPYGFNDDGKTNIIKLIGSSIGFRNFQRRKELQEEKEMLEREYYASTPQTPEEANLWFIKQRKRTPEQQEAEDKRIQTIRDSLK